MIEYCGTWMNADIPSFACWKWCCCCCNSEKVSMISGFDCTKKLNDFSRRNKWWTKLCLMRFVRSETKQGQYVFDIPTVANSIGVTATILSNHLQNLKVWILWKKILFWEKLTISVENIRRGRLNGIMAPTYFCFHLYISPVWLVRFVPTLSHPWYLLKKKPIFSYASLDLFEVMEWLVEKEANLQIGPLISYLVLLSSKGGKSTVLSSPNVFIPRCSCNLSFFLLILF